MNENTKIVVTIIFVLVAGFIVAIVLGDEENWGTSYASLGRTVTAFFAAGVFGFFIWLIWKK